MSANEQTNALSGIIIDPPPEGEQIIIVFTGDDDYTLNWVRHTDEGITHCVWWGSGNMTDALEHARKRVAHDAKFMSEWY